MDELYQSKSDIRDMRDNKTTEFRYEKASKNKNKPETKPTGTNDNGHSVITMYYDSGTQVHESRHGGQIARGEYGFNSNNQPDSRFGLDAEVSAYRAQYAFSGFLSYYDVNNLNKQIVEKGGTPIPLTVNNIHTFTRDFVGTRIGEIFETNYKKQTIRYLAPLYGNLK